MSEPKTAAEWRTRQAWAEKEAEQEDRRQDWLEWATKMPLLRNTPDSLRRYAAHCAEQAAALSEPQPEPCATCGHPAQWSKAYWRCTQIGHACTRDGDRQETLIEWNAMQRALKELQP